jgi:ribonuclease P protein component
MTASGQLTSFPKSSRIQASADFRANRENGNRLAKGCILANWKNLPSGNPSRLGVITSRRIGKAHIRNDARRLMRECFRLHQHELLQPVDLVLVARRSIVDRRFHSVERHFLSLLKKAGLLPEHAAPVYATAH